MKLGVNVPDSAIDERIRMLAPNQCCSLIFTVGFRQHYLQCSYI